jgi:SAM-dependent methyltransferase
MTSTQHRDAAGIFIDAWSLYGRVVSHNHMYHREIFADVGEYLRARFGGEAISVCDLGCGDARHFSDALRGLSVRSYQGCDLSETALAQARTNVASLGLEAELACADLSDYLRDGAKQFELVFSSFALHHLSTAEKGEAFRQVSRSLGPGGLFLLVDVARYEGESHESYMRAYCDWIRNEWDGFSPEELATICDHITGNDLPETVATLARLAAAAGLSAPEPVNRYRWHHILAFGKTG